MEGAKLLGTALTCILIQGCATTPNTTTSHAPASDENIEIWYQEAKPFVSENLAVSLSDIPLEIQDKGEMYLTHRNLSKRYIEERFKGDAKKKIIDSQIEHSLDRTIAIYDPHNRRIVVDQKNFLRYISRFSARGHSPKQAAMTVLVHELVHAADDANYDLMSLHEKKPWNTLTISAVIEGHAQQQTEIICRKLDCADAFKDDEYFLSFLPAITGTGKLLPTMRGDNVTLKYVNGTDFLRDLQGMEGGTALVDRALKNAPGDVLTLFNSERFLDDTVTQSSDILAVSLSSKKMQWLSNWISSPKSAFTESSFPRRSERRDRYIKSRVDNLLGSAMMSYYPPSGHSLTPITVKLFQARSEIAAKQEATQAFRDVRHNTAGILGWSLSLRNIKTWSEEESTNGQKLSINHFRAHIYNSDTEKTTPYQVSVLNTRDAVAEISSFETPVVHNRAVDVVKNLISEPNTPTDQIAESQQTEGYNAS